MYVGLLKIAFQAQLSSNQDSTAVLGVTLAVGFQQVSSRNIHGMLNTEVGPQSETPLKWFCAVDVHVYHIPSEALSKEAISSGMDPSLPTKELIY